MKPPGKREWRLVTQLGRAPCRVAHLINNAPDGIPITMCGFNFGDEYGVGMSFPPGEASHCKRCERMQEVYAKARKR